MDQVHCMVIFNITDHARQVNLRNSLDSGLLLHSFIVPKLQKVYKNVN